jgi:hypothetical protein
VGLNRHHDEAEDRFLSLVKNAKPDQLADAMLAADLLRQAQPELFVSDRTFGQERLKLLLHLDPMARRFSKDGSIVSLVRLHPRVVESLDGFVRGCLSQAREETPGHQPQLPPEKPLTVLQELLRDFPI